MFFLHHIQVSSKEVAHPLRFFPRRKHERHLIGLLKKKSADWGGTHYVIRRFFYFSSVVLKPKTAVRGRAHPPPQKKNTAIVSTHTHTQIYERTCGRVPKLINNLSYSKRKGSTSDNYPVYIQLEKEEEEDCDGLRVSLFKGP